MTTFLRTELFWKTNGKRYIAQRQKPKPNLLLADTCRRGRVCSGVNCPCYPNVSLNASIEEA